jgi:hypothetical protein
MAYGEDIIKLRKRISDAVSAGLFDPATKDTVEVLLLQIMNDAEKNRQQCVSQAENLRRQASLLDGQAGGFSSLSSIVYNVLNGLVQASEKAAREMTEKEGEETEDEAL